MVEFEVLSRDKVRFTRTLPTPPEQAWPHLSNARKLAQWFLPVTSFEPRLGGRYIIPTDNGGLDGALTEFQPPTVINFDAKMRFELTSLPSSTLPDATLLTLTLRRSDPGWIPSTLASFPTMLDNLTRLSSGLPVLERAAYMQAWRNHYPLCEQSLSTALAHGAKLVYRLHFPSGEDKPAGDTAGRTELHNLLTLLLNNPSLHLAIDGFADEPLDRTKAFRLSQRRAETIKRHLIANTIVPERLTTRAFGNYYRLHPARDEESTRLNRRVELIPLY